MKKLKELLQDADPMRHEAEIPTLRQAQSRQAVIAAASAVKSVGMKPQLQIRRLALVVVALLAVVFVGSRILPLRDFETHASVLFELRLAEETPGPGLIEAKTDDKTIYLHPDSVVNNEDIAHAEVVPGNSSLQFSVSVILTPAGARKMSDATQAHWGKPIAIIVDNEVVAAPIIRSVISDAAIISGNYTEREAQRIANGLR